MTVGELKKKIKDLPDDYEIVPTLGDYDPKTNSYKVYLTFGKRNEIKKYKKEIEYENSN